MHRSTLVLSLIAFLFFACKKEGTRSCLKKSGKRIHRTRDITGIRAIELHDHVELLIEKSSNEGVEVQAGEKLAPLIETEERGDTLLIRDRNSCRWLRSYDAIPKVTVRTQGLEHLSNHGTADVRMKGSIERQYFLYEQWNGMGDVELNLNTDTAAFKLHSGSGRLIGNGKSDHAYCYLASSGFLKLEDLEVRDAFAWNQGSGNISLFVSEELRARIQSIGSIQYRGNGELTEQENSGSGEIVKTDG